MFKYIADTFNSDPRTGIGDIINFISQLKLQLSWRNMYFQRADLLRINSYHYFGNNNRILMFVLSCVGENEGRNM
jgi:hypothetical protein